MEEDFNIEEEVKNNRILHLALVVGLIAQLVILTIFIVGDNIEMTLPKTLDYFLISTMLFAIFAPIIGRMLYSNQVKSISPDQSMSDKAKIYRSAKITKWALMEGAGLVSVIFFAFTNPNILLFITSICMILTLWLNAPSRLELENILKD